MSVRLLARQCKGVSINLMDCQMRTHAVSGYCFLHADQEHDTHPYRACRVTTSQGTFFQCGRVGCRIGAHDVMARLGVTEARRAATGQQTQTEGE